MKPVQQTMDVDLRLWLSIASTILYYTLYPLLAIATWLFYLIRFIASPFIYLAYIFTEVVLLPMRILAQFEVK